MVFNQPHPGLHPKIFPVRVCHYRAVGCCSQYQNSLTCGWEYSWSDSPEWRVHLMQNSTYQANLQSLRSRLFQVYNLLVLMFLPNEGELSSNCWLQTPSLWSTNMQAQSWNLHQCLPMAYEFIWHAHCVCENLLSEHLFSQQSQFWVLGSGGCSSAVMCRRDTRLWMQTSIWTMSDLLVTSLPFNACAHHTNLCIPH